MPGSASSGTSERYFASCFASASGSFQEIRPWSVASPDPVRSSNTAQLWLARNVRELRNVMERVALLAAGQEVALNNLPSALLGAAETVAVFPEEDRLLTLRELEERQIRQILNLGVSMDRAAELLGITSVTLGRKRKELCLRWDCAEVKSIAVAAG